mgnify:CR=1 FL=1
MLKHLLLIVLVTASMGVNAEMFKCKNPAGGTEYSDTPCKADSTSEIIADRDTLTPQQQAEAQQRLQEQTQAASELAAQRSAAQADTAPQVAPAPAAASDEEVVYGCNDGRRVNSNCASTPNDSRPPYRRPNPGPGRPTPR